jgi:hypothetical protein
MHQDEMRTLLIGIIHKRMRPHHYWKRNSYGLRNINYTQALGGRFDSNTGTAKITFLLD